MRSKALHIFSILLLLMGIPSWAMAQGPVFPAGSDQPKSKIKILGNVYGGGDQAAVLGNTEVEINKGQYAGDIFGGGNGALYDGTDGEHEAGTVKTSADIGTRYDNTDGEHEAGDLVEHTGATSVTINGGEIIFDNDHPSNHNIYGGGNLACNIADSTKVQMNVGMVTWYTFLSNQAAAIPAWYDWYDQAMNPNTQKTPIIALFGAGYGAHTDVAGNTNVRVNIPGTADIHPANGTAFTHAELESIDQVVMRWMPDHRMVGQFVSAIHGGGYDGTVGAYDKDTYVTNPASGGIKYDKTDYTSQTNVSITGQPFVFHVYGGGLGSKTGADSNGSVNSHVGAVYGAAIVDIQGGIINGDVFGGGAGIAGQATIPNPFPGAVGGETVNLPYTYAAQVMRETDVTIDGNSTVIFGNVYGGGDIANTGWHDEGARPTMTGHVEQVNTSLAKLDYTTSLHLKGGNILGKVFGGGNGRKKSEVEQYKFVGAVIGSTNVEVNGSTIWGDIYGGGNTGCIYSCQTIAGTQGAEGRKMVNGVLDGSTNVQILDGKVARDIFGGGYGDDPNFGDEDMASSADIYGNAFVYFKEADLEFEKYWKPREIATNETMGSWTNPTKEVTGRFLDQRSGYDAVNDIDYRNSESDITHNLYGGGNMACTIFGNTYVYMSGAPTAPIGFNTTDYYNECIANVAKPHFSVFGGGFGSLAKVTHNAYSDINLAKGTGLHSIIGGGMNGPIGDICQVHVGNDPMSLVHHVYGGGYYASSKGTELEITRGTILENVFGGSVMGNIWAENDDSTKVVTRTIIGLQTEGTDRHSAVNLEDENGTILRQYTYAQHKNQITIGGNVYGANDVSGTVNGVASLTIYGGTIKGDVYGAGNGDHIGYYVPDELKYDLGTHQTDNYFTVIHHELGAPNGKTYVGRPQTIGGVELTLEGNTTEERVKVLGQVFGGGNSCTIGGWDKTLLSTTYFSNPHLARDDAKYFLGGGKIDMNLGSHITIGRTHKQLAESADGANYLVDVDGTLENVSGLYMGCSGRHLATQDPSKTNNYYHHYYDASTAQYWPGFAVYQDNSDTPLTRQEGLQSFLAYMNNILVWSDDVNLNIKNQDNTDAEDIWISNFVGGGFRGSMKAKTKDGQFHYTLPRGVTIGHDIIGGAFNTDVVYRIFETIDGHTYSEENGLYKYLTNVGTLTQADESNTTGDYHHIEYAADGKTPTGIVRFYYDGGMLSELAYGTPKASNDRIDRILKKYSIAGGSDINKDFAGENTTTNVAFNRYKRDALVYLELDNRLQVEYVDGHVHGGNVFGGCFSSGRVEGDIWTDYRCFQESQQANSEDFNLSDRSFNNAKSFEENFAMMLFGAGYGANTNIQGSAYVRVLHPEKNPNAPIPGMAYGYPRLYNVFGGSYEGKVEGNTNIYFNPGKYGYVTGAIYGGGCNGYVGGKTYLELAGGYIDEAYGGARNANIGGGTHIWAYDGQKRWWGEDVIHSNGDPMAEADAEKAPLFIGKLYGGTDISGQICTDEHGLYTKENGYQPYFSAEYWPKELYQGYDPETYDPANPPENMTYIDTYLQVGGTGQNDSGFPVIGALYAAGNGEETKSFFDAKYAASNLLADKYEEAKLPTLHSTLMEVSDGNIVYAFGGGNNATVTDQNYILVRTPLAGKHEIEDLGVQMYEVMKKRVLSIGVDCYDEKLVDGKKVLDLKNASIQRLFGGNNVATMAIQPKWQLISGRVNNVYSGGNMGDMTYYNPVGKPATEDGTITGKPGAVATDGSNSNYTPRGLSITIEHPEIHIGSLYGGCRLSDVIPGGYATDGDGNYILDTNGNKTLAKASELAQSEDFYGATVNITDGYIENVYGGNDISGTVYIGTNVNISGAVSGNVYGSGNGLYFYQWDKDATSVTEHLLKESTVADFTDPKYDKALYYKVPANAAFGGYDADATQKILTINAARPSVEKAFLNIAGLAHYPAGNENPKRVAYVKGNVFCGGNASTVTGAGETFTKFKIGSYVTLNGVFMGSDGEKFSKNEEKDGQIGHLDTFEKLNGFDLTAAASYGDGKIPEAEKKYYPNLLAVHMKAVEMKAQPKDFNLNLPLEEAHIGTYCGGGNRGSMLVDKVVELPFHHDIIIYDKVVAACLDANVTYKDAKAWGGYTRPIADPAHNTNKAGENVGNTKMDLIISSQFVPLVMDVPADKLPGTVNGHNENFVTAAAHDFLYDNRTTGVKYDYQEFNELFEGHWTSQTEFEQNADPNIQWKEAPGLYAPSCNIYGGCYQTGEIEGDVVLKVHSNMLRYVNENNLQKTIAENIPCFNVYGAGFGQDSHVWGSVKIVMDRSLDPSTMGDQIATSTLSNVLVDRLGGADKFDIWDRNLTKPYGTNGKGNVDCSYPSFNNVFGGGRNGKLIGNSTIEVRNGLVYSDVVGGCYASDMYGSTQVIVGYPKYYRCNTSGMYYLERGDRWNTDKKDAYGDKVVKDSIFYLYGDLVPNNVCEQIVAKDASKNSCFNSIDIIPSAWDDIHIKIGRGVFGGGYSLANSTAASAGSVTTHKLNDSTIDWHTQNFNSRYGYSGNTSGYGGNSSIMVGDQKDGTIDHIHISTLKSVVATIPATSSVIGKFVLEDGKYTHQGDHLPKSGETYYTLSGEGGIYGDGHLTFCEGFRTADITNYGYAEGTAKHPVLLNTFQRMDLLSVNDCCLMLQGAQDFATDQIDATIYSITRINELRMNSSLDAAQKLGEISAPSGSREGAMFDTEKQRNYLAFFNNVHYLGSIVSNDPFGSRFHKKDGSLIENDSTYIVKKQRYIDEYNSSVLDSGGNKTAAATEEFKKRNVATARNAIGINNGYCLRVQNQEYVGTQPKTYYGPIVGVCEVKLLTLVQGEGGGYVYADNIHEAYDGHNENDYFLMTSGNFVFPGIVEQGVDPVTNEKIGDQYIVDDCFLEHFGETNNITKKHRAIGAELDDAHYWYVEGNKYYYTTTLTGFTYQKAIDFDLVKTDPNIILPGMKKGSELNIKKIEWLSTESGFHRNDYAAVLPNTTVDKIDDYEFDFEVGGYDNDDWKSDMPRYSVGGNDLANYFTTGKTIQNDHLPQFNIKLQDKLDNSGDANYINHLDEPELVKIYLVGETEGHSYEYTITVNIVYLQGPTVSGGVKIENCALPGELITFSTEGLHVKTPELMPITSASWQILPLKEIDEHGVWKWEDNGIVIPDDRYGETTTGDIEGTIRALYKQNEYTIAYIFTAGGYDFPVLPAQTTSRKENRMIVVHNYHRMKDVLSQDLQIETMPSAIPDHQTGMKHPALAEAKLYIEDEEDLRAFIEYLNVATDGNAAKIPVGLAGLDIILQKDIKLTQPLPTISQPFAGNFHGDGFHIDLNEYGTSFLGSNLTGKVYNLGLVGGTIAEGASTGSIINSYVYDDAAASDADFIYGKKAYALSHYFTPTEEGGSTIADAEDQPDPTLGYVYNRYANGDYQYATSDRAWSLRTEEAPNYGSADTHHDQEHTHDVDRWNQDDEVNIPLYDGTRVVADRQKVVQASIITYPGLPERYANDYLFFGQHLDLDLDLEHADDYPMHIEPVATGDPATGSGTKDGNRVYETAGYYRSSVNGGFYYNKDAWALQPTITAIDFTSMTAEGDGAETLPVWFNADSNKDYDKDGNHRDSSTPYDNAVKDHVSQNLLVYNAGEALFAKAGSVDYEDCHESDILYHNIVKKDDVFGTDYFHLVDKQDFWAPIAFNVGTRAWYERKPQTYRNVTTVGYGAGSAWEGIVLPFTATKVSAEKNGEISHFYGDSDLHHEYWLRGFKGVGADGGKTLASFARPAVSGDEYFTNTLQEGISYTYPANSYFTGLFDYNDHYDTRDDEGDDVMDKHEEAWYAQEHTFADYVPLTAAVPYIVAFPGDDFYEFSMESNASGTYGSVPYRQMATFEASRTSVDPAITIPVTDAMSTSVGDYQHTGTFLRLTGEKTTNAAGTAFANKDEDSHPAVTFPFRTYMQAPASSPAPSRAIIRIGFGGDEDDEEGDTSGATSFGFKFKGLEVIVTSTYPDNHFLDVYNAQGMHLIHHIATSGESRFTLPGHGVYVIGGRKVSL